LLKKVLLPDYDELTMFQFGIAFLYLFFTNSDLRDQFAVFHDSYFIGFILVNILKWIAILLFFFGSFLSIGNAIFQRTKPKINKWFVLTFAVFINFFIAIYTIRYLQAFHIDYLVILPGINLIHACCIFFMWRMRHLKIHSISEEDAPLFEVIVSFILMLIILDLLQNKFNNYWAITFTIAISYSAILNSALVNLINSFREYFLK